MENWQSNTALLPPLPYQAHTSVAANFNITKQRCVEVSSVWICRGPQRAKGVRHAIVQCYVKEPLFDHFTMSDEKKQVACQSNCRAMTRCPGWFLCGHQLHYASVSLCMSQWNKKGWLVILRVKKIDLCYSGALDQCKALVKTLLCHSLNQSFGRN